jgi:hypothetical protein
MLPPITDFAFSLCQLKALFQVDSMVDEVERIQSEPSLFSIKCGE